MSVFLSYAGEQERMFVEFLYHYLREEGVTVFVDEQSLVPGESGWNSIVAALNEAAVGATAPCSSPLCVIHTLRFALRLRPQLLTAAAPLAVVVVLSPEYVRKRNAMLELEILLARPRSSFYLLPVWLGISYEQCADLATGYENDNWVGGKEKPAAVALTHWAGLLRQLLRTAAKRSDQVCSSTSEAMKDYSISDSACAVHCLWFMMPALTRGCVREDAVPRRQWPYGVFCTDFSDKIPEGRWAAANFLYAARQAGCAHAGVPDSGPVDWARGGSADGVEQPEAAPCCSPFGRRGRGQNQHRHGGGLPAVGRGPGPGRLLCDRLCWWVFLVHVLTMQTSLLFPG